MKKVLTGFVTSFMLLIGLFTVTMAAPMGEVKEHVVEDTGSVAQETKLGALTSAGEVKLASESVWQSVVGKTSFKVSWKAYPGTTYYYYAVTDSSKKVVKTGRVTGTSVTISGLKQGRVYGFAEMACNSAGESLAGASAEGCVCVTVPTNTTVKEMAYANSKYNMLLSYAQSTAGYRIQYYNYKTKKSATKYFTTEKPALSLGRTSVYKLTITPYTKVLSKKYYGGKTTYYAMNPPLVKKKSNTKSSMTVQWTKMTSVNSYTIYVKKPGGSFKKMTTTTGGSYTLKSMKLNQTYYIKVVANKKVGSKTYTSPKNAYYTMRLYSY